MKTSKTVLLAALVLGVSALLATAQDENQGPGGNRPPRQGGGSPGGQGGQGGPGQGGQGGGQRMMGGAGDGCA